MKLVFIFLVSVIITVCVGAPQKEIQEPEAEPEQETGFAQDRQNPSWQFFNNIQEILNPGLYGSKRSRSGSKKSSHSSESSKTSDSSDSSSSPSYSESSSSPSNSDSSSSASHSDSRSRRSSRSSRSSHSSSSSSSSRSDQSRTENECGCVCGVPNQKLRIVGGNVTRPNEYPWVVALEKRGKFYCGATLITRRHVVTAAHCIDGFNFREIKVYMGVHNRMKLNNAVSSSIKKVTVNPKFDIFTFDNDIAIIELDTRIELSTIVRPACLPENNDRKYTNEVAIVAGWGRLGEKKGTATELMKVDVPVMTIEDCRKSGYGEKRITDNMICAGYDEGQKDGCQGDSGGPMHIKVGSSTTELIGVVSWGRGCARPKFPGVYTRVANYIDWIKKTVGDECMCPRP